NRQRHQEREPRDRQIAQDAVNVVVPRESHGLRRQVRRLNEGKVPRPLGGREKIPPRVEADVARAEVPDLRLVIEAQLIFLAELQRVAKARVVVPGERGADQGEREGGGARGTPREASFAPPPRE